jgi:hypothetical protein
MSTQRKWSLFSYTGLRISSAAIMPWRLLSQRRGDAPGRHRALPSIAAKRVVLPDDGTASMSLPEVSRNVGAAPIGRVDRHVRSSGVRHRLRVVFESGSEEATILCRRSILLTLTLASTQSFDQTPLGGREQLRKHSEVGAARTGELERSRHVDPNHVPAWRQPQLTLAGEKHFPSFVLLPADQGVLAIGTEPPVGPRLAPGTGKAVVSAGSTIVGPSARLEVPAAERPNPFFAAFSSTWRSVNSWKKRSPTG